MDTQWEMCVPIESSVWFWSGGKEANTKDLEHCVKLLAMCASGDGNLLLNISPMPDGRIQPLQAEILRGMGQWLDRYGESIYGTRGGPYMPGIWGGSSRKGNKIYLHVMQELLGSELTLPPLPAGVVGNRVLTGGSATVTQDKASLKVVLDEAARETPIDRIIELELAGDALGIAPVETKPSQSLSRNATATRTANSPTNGRAGNELRTPPPTLPAKKRAEGEIGRPSRTTENRGLRSS